MYNMSLYTYNTEIYIILVYYTSIIILCVCVLALKKKAFVENVGVDGSRMAGRLDRRGPFPAADSIATKTEKDED